MMVIISQTTDGSLIEFSGIDADLAELHWTKTDRSYLIHRKRDIIRYAHHIVISRKLGYSIPPGKMVDHIDHNPLNNRRDNLRLATCEENLRNTKIRKNNTSGFKGVSKERDMWRAELRIKGKAYYLGAFSTAVEAAKVYNKAAIEHFGEFASLNRIP